MNKKLNLLFIQDKKQVIIIAIIKVNVVVKEKKRVFSLVSRKRTRLHTQNKIVSQIKDSIKNQIKSLLFLQQQSSQSRVSIIYETYNILKQAHKLCLYQLRINILFLQGSLFFSFFSFSFTVLQQIQRGKSTKKYSTTL